MKQLVFDIGGTNIKYALFSATGELLEKAQRPTPDNLASFKSLLEQIAGQYQGQFDGIAVCAPGTIDGEKQLIHYGGALQYLDGLDLTILADKFQVPVRAINDGKAAALAELWRGQLVGINNGCVMTLGTGVGGGIVINGELLSGNNFQAGEFSWVILDANRSVLGNAGRLCSAVKMIEEVNIACGNPNIKDGEAAFSALEEPGSVAGRQIFNRYCSNVAYLIVNIQAILNLERVVIGGGISAQPRLVATIENQLAKYLKLRRNFGDGMTAPAIVAAKFKNDANLYGAWYNLKKHAKF
ncbi:ROK family protein [Lactobacillus corticis]|uniref:Transcriptional regulator / sugar kinase NagC n=1 Tax=Lactobacillus corticis TaxID=2201249 RepID=A0A916QIN7_9LACO|nr:ROK family protein [Lactobacillus corticis]GFZ26812.1 transcriptional regulator / sugar kinase NagC [Lactobacillus corticis]